MKPKSGSGREAGKVRQDTTQLQLVRQDLTTMTQPTLAQRQARFQVYVERTRQRLFQFARRTLGNAQDAEDVTQEALSRAWTHFEVFDPHGSFEAWVFRIASNLMIDRNRRHRRKPEISLDGPATYMSEYEGGCRFELADSAGDPQNCLLAKEISTDLHSALRSLPRLHRETLLLVAQEHSYEEIARACGCPLGTVRSRVHRARVMLQSSLHARSYPE